MTLKPFRSLFTFALVVGFSIRLLAEDAPPAEEQLKALIPRATSINAREFEKLATDTKSPTKESFSEYSLSAAIMCLSVDRTQEVAGQDDFHYITGKDKTPKPARLAGEMYRVIGAGRFRWVIKPVTVIHAERITDFTAKINGDKATGTFAFRVPDLYEGKAKFTATKKKDGWEMQAFAMPGVKIHVARDDAGKWRDVSEDEAHDAAKKAMP